MSGQKPLTVDQLIVLSGLDKSPSEVTALLQPGPIKRLWRWLGNGVKRYTLVRAQDFVLDSAVKVMMCNSLMAACVIVFATIALCPISSADVIMASIFAAVCGIIYVVFIALRCAEAEEGFKGLRFTRNLVLSPFDLLLFPVLKDIMIDCPYTKTPTWIGDSEKREQLVLGKGSELSQAAGLKLFYTTGLKRVEEELIGPNSDWNMALLDLEDRLAKADQSSSEIHSQLSSKRNTNDDNRIRMLEGAKARIISTKRSLVDAIQHMNSLLYMTKDELKKLNALVNEYVDTFQSAEIVRKADALASYREPAFDHGNEPLLRAHEKIIRQLKAVVTVVTSHKLLPDPKDDGTKVLRYFDEIEIAATAIAKIGEA